MDTEVLRVPCPGLAHNALPFALCSLSLPAGYDVRDGWWVVKLEEPCQMQIPEWVYRKELLTNIRSKPSLCWAITCLGLFIIANLSTLKMHRIRDDFWNNYFTFLFENTICYQLNLKDLSQHIIKLSFFFFFSYLQNACNLLKYSGKEDHLCFFTYW